MASKKRIREVLNKFREDNTKLSEQDLEQKKKLLGALRFGDDKNPSKSESKDDDDKSLGVLTPSEVEKIKKTLSIKKKKLERKSEPESPAMKAQIKADIENIKKLKKKKDEDE